MRDKRDGNKKVRVHRWVIAQIHGWDAIEGKQVKHRCDNPPCFRYDHLEVGTHEGNMADRSARERTAKGSGHGMSKLTEQQVREIRSMSGPQAAIAAAYGVSVSNISAILTGKTWASCQ